jgi:N-acetylglucosaminyl-diphospho-decaprenol L-rhamnosyltransferase
MLPALSGDFLKESLKMGESLPELCVVVLNWNGKHHLVDLLPSLIEAKAAYDGQCRLVVLNNPGPSDDLEWVQENFPTIDAVEAPQNDYLYSYNWFLPQISERVVVFLNNDLRVDKGFLAPLARPFENPEIFSTCAKSLSWHGKETTSAAYRATLHHGWVYWENVNSDHPVETLFSVGGFMAVDRVKFLELGGFDRIFHPAYGEDVDLCIRARVRGWKSIYIPESVVWHKEGASWNSGDNPRRELISTKTHLLVQWRHFGGWQRDLERGIYLLYQVAIGKKGMIFIKAWLQARKKWREQSVDGLLIVQHII